jgi:hypothetical protein
MTGAPKRIVFLMRGLPGTGKSHMARRLAGTDGFVLETDEYFLTQVGTDPGRFDYDEKLITAAREWNLNRFRDALKQQHTPIVVDRGNGLNPETRAYAVEAVRQGYDVQLAEPDSPWWLELRVLLKYQAFVDTKLLDSLADFLAAKTRQLHRVPAATIRHWMNGWRYDLTIQEILESDPA